MFSCQTRKIQTVIIRECLDRPRWNFTHGVCGQPSICNQIYSRKFKKCSHIKETLRMNGNTMKRWFDILNFQIGEEATWNFRFATFMRESIMEVSFFNFNAKIVKQIPFATFTRSYCENVNFQLCNCSTSGLSSFFRIRQIIRRLNVDVPFQLGFPASRGFLMRNFLLEVAGEFVPGSKPRARRMREYVHAYTRLGVMSRYLRLCDLLAVGAEQRETRNGIEERTYFAPGSQRGFATMYNACLVFQSTGYPAERAYSLRSCLMLWQCSSPAAANIKAGQSQKRLVPMSVDSHEFFTFKRYLLALGRCNLGLETKERRPAVSSRYWRVGAPALACNSQPDQRRVPGNPTRCWNERSVW